MKLKAGFFDTHQYNNKKYESPIAPENCPKK